MRNIVTTLGYIILFLFTLDSEVTLAQPASQGVNHAPATTFELKNGDRVVFLGNSLFENDLSYGYLELALTTRWPTNDVTFRNIGWTGDTVWGQARSYISSPSAYDLLMEQLTNTQPTVVFVAYGGIEALEGEAGLSHFTKGLNQLLDKIEELGAKAILLSPIPVMAGESPEKLEKRNAMLAFYASAIAKTASERGKQFIDIYHPLLENSKQMKLSDNGFHLNEAGYYYLVSAIEQGLGLAPRNNSVVIEVAKTAANATTSGKVVDNENNNEGIKFTIGENFLPLPFPKKSEGMADKAWVFKITGLKKGIYTLTADNVTVITASANDWKDGVEIRRGAMFDQVSQLREMILKKNELFFYQYRPQNRTYILGFRSHEQGRHAKGLEELSVIITWLEGQIALQRTPKQRIYQLTPIK